MLIFYLVCVIDNTWNRCFSIRFIFSKINLLIINRKYIVSQKYIDLAIDRCCTWQSINFSKLYVMQISILFVTIETTTPLACFLPIAFYR